ncbi:MAG: hypothetical protein IKG00_03335 [Lachnospiraceae bacterium]|nr:hypothetical protein [Lachnospiraceae bacterium]
MPRYLNLDGDSGIESYEIGEDYITVYFIRSHKGYTYSYKSAGQAHVEAMKQLANCGKGLNEYINKNTRNLYER